MAKPYHIWMVRDDTGGPPQWVVGIEELRGCLSQGDTPEHALEMIREAMELWIEVSLEHGDSIPEPRSELEEFSGKFQVRMPASLHEKLARESRREGVSLNQFVVSALAGAVGWRKPQEKREAQPRARAKKPA
jgi:antitoxin HicB